MRRIVLRSAGVALLLTTSCAHAIPRVVHWGGDVEVASVDEFDAIAEASRHAIAPSTVDHPLVVTMLPDQRYGYAGKPGLIGSRGGEDWAPAWELDRVVVDGSDNTDELINHGAGAVEFHLRSSGLTMVLEVQMLPQGIIRTRASLTNTGEDPYELQELTIALPVPSRAREVHDLAGRWGNERTPQRRTLTVGQHRRESRHGRTGFDSPYVLNLGTSGFGFAHGEVWGVHVAWSGNHIHYAERDASGAQVLGGGELLLPGEGRIAAGETYVMPWLYGNHAVGLDAQMHRFHDHYRSLEHAPGPERPVTLNVWEAVHFDHDLGRLVDLADRAADLGVERFVLDDGWFGARRSDQAGLGDWVVSAEVWPDGLHPLVDHVRGKGMEFGLWFEPEMVNLDSDVARAHPEWIMQPAGRLPLPARFQHVLNLAMADAYDHVLGQVSAILDEYDIAYVKWDHNRDLIEAGTAPQGHAAVSAQTRAFYRLLDDLRSRHPEVEFESCSSGGGRIDLEVMQRAERVWVSDNIDPEDRQQMLAWTSQLLPPEVQGSHIASGRSQVTLRWHDVNFRAATAVFGHLGIEWDLAEASPEELADLGGWIQWWKQNRDVLLGGRMHRGDMEEPGVHFKGVVAQRKAIFSLCMLSTTPTAHIGTLTFPGLDPDASYRVTIRDRQHLMGVLQLGWAAEGLVLSGRALGTMGIQAPILQPATAVLFELERV